MTATAHALVGGAIAAFVKDPVLGVTLAATSHPILDSIPHWDFAANWRSKHKLVFLAQAVGDFVIGLLIAWLLFHSLTSIGYLFTCIFAATVWDMMEVPYWFWDWRFPPFSWSHNIQSHLQGKARLPWGAISQVVTVSVIIWVLWAIK